MAHEREFFIDGSWVAPQSDRHIPVINPATEQPIVSVAMGGKSDVDSAVAAARSAFPAYSRTSSAERLALFEAVLRCYQNRYDEIAHAISLEMGAPLSFSTAAQAAAGAGHLQTMCEILAKHPFEERQNQTQILYEPIGVCGLITPWNWPVNQIMCKVVPALAAGCTVVLKPSEIAPLSALLLAEVFEAAGTPKGVFNLVNGAGPDVGLAIATHPDIDMVSFTGSTRAGVAVAKAAADSVKRVAQELGGKSPYVILEGADLHAAVQACVMGCMMNSGQSCNAPTRLLAPQHLHDEIAELARECAESIVVGDPFDEGSVIGPLVSETHWRRVQDMVAVGITEGARLVTGGLGRPEGLARGYFVKPTVFAKAKNTMRIAREEIFGPVLTIIPYQTVDDAIEQANDTDYGLAAYVNAADVDVALGVARQLRAGTVHINDAPNDLAAPFGGYKQSGNGREWGRYGLDDFLEVKAIMGAVS